MSATDDGVAGQGRENAVRIGLLGGFTAEIKGEQITLPLDAQRLVAFLAIEGRPRSRAYVAGRLWSEGTQDRALGNLRSALWRVRRQETSLIAADSQNLSLLPGVEVDLQEMDELASRLDATSDALTGPDVDHTRFTKELLTGWYDDWILVERERVRQVCLHALETIALRLLTTQRLTAAHEAALAAVSLEPLRESANRIVIQIHVAEGNYNEAVRHYERYANAIGEELGLVPSPIIEELISNLRLTV